MHARLHAALVEERAVRRAGVEHERGAVAGAELPRRSTLGITDIHPITLSMVDASPCESFSMSAK